MQSLDVFCILKVCGGKIWNKLDSAVCYNTMVRG